MVLIDVFFLSLQWVGDFWGGWSIFLSIPQIDDKIHQSRVGFWGGLTVDGVSCMFFCIMTADGVMSRGVMTGWWLLWFSRDAGFRKGDK